MSNTAEPTEPFREHFAADATPGTAATRPTVGTSKPKPFGGLGLKAAARAAATPKLTRVVSVAFLGLALGGVFGLWLHTRLAAASLPLRPSAQAAPFARPSGTLSLTSPNAPESTPKGHDAHTSSPADAAPPPLAEAPLSAQVLGTRSSVTAVEERASLRAKDATKAGEATPRINEHAREDAATAAASAPKATSSTPKAVKAAGRVSPCAIYASAGSLTLRSGSSAPLILGGPGPFAVTTPDWSDIVVFSEGRTGGGKSGWTKYAVKSVSKRAGVYTLHVKSPCDSQTIRVRVTPL